MNNKHFHDTPLLWGEGGCKGKRGNLVFSLKNHTNDIKIKKFLFFWPNAGMNVKPRFDYQILIQIKKLREGVKSSVTLQ